MKKSRKERRSAKKQSPSFKIKRGKRDINKFDQSEEIKSKKINFRKAAICAGP
jgi:hypothetical protein